MKTGLTAIALVVLFVFGFLSVVIYERSAFRQACIEKGGVPLIGRYHSMVCFKKDILL